jgi:heat shock protein HslJ
MIGGRDVEEAELMARTTRWHVLVCTLLLAALAVTGCGETVTQDPTTLEGVEWTLVDSSETSADLTTAGITASFDGATVAGFSGVNQYGGPYTAGDDGSLEIGEIAGTLMAGPEGLMQAEQAYLKLLKGCDRWQVDGDTLTLSTGDEATLTYEKAAAVELPGTSWKVVNYNNGKDAVVSLVAGSELTMEFGSDGYIGGSGGVNRYHGAYEVDGASISIGPLASTKMAGEPELMDQEAAFLKALEASTQWTVVRGRLELRDADGAGMVFADAAK